MFGIAINHAGFRHIVETQERISAAFEGFLGVFTVVQLKFHIALPAGKPHFTDQHVVIFDEIVACGNAQRVRSAFGLRGQHNAPRRKAVLDFFGGVRVRLHDHGTIEIAYFRRNLKSGAVGIQRTEHGNGFVTLQHHMRGENRGNVQNSCRATVIDGFNRCCHFRTKSRTSRSDHDISS